jgi:enolase-phosphatase E1
MTEQINAENKLVMSQAFKILTDIWGVITSWDFRHDLQKYAINNLDKYLTQNWEQEFVQDFVKQLREQTLEDQNENNSIDMPIIQNEVPENSKEMVIKSTVDNIEWRRVKKFKSFDSQLDEFNYDIWADGYRTKALKTHAFDDVMTVFHNWKHELYIKIYTFASGSPDFQKLFLSASIRGDISQYIITGIDSRHKYKYDPKKYKALLSSVVESIPKNMLYLTDNPKKAKAAIESGMRAVVVLRPGNKQYTNEELNGLSIVSSLQDIVFQE